MSIFGRCEECDQDIWAEREVLELKQENARLREALEIYADEKNWVSDKNGDRLKFFYFAGGIALDEGCTVAKKTLDRTK